MGIHLQETAYTLLLEYGHHWKDKQDIKGEPSLQNKTRKYMHIDERTMQTRKIK